MQTGGVDQSPSPHVAWAVQTSCVIVCFFHGQSWASMWIMFGHICLFICVYHMFNYHHANGSMMQQLMHCFWINFSFDFEARYMFACSSKAVYRTSVRTWQGVPEHWCLWGAAVWMHRGVSRAFIGNMWQRFEQVRAIRIVGRRKKCYIVRHVWGNNATCTHPCWFIFVRVRHTYMHTYMQTHIQKTH